MARKMDVPDPIYQWLLRLKGELSVARGRNVTYPEVWEHVKTDYEAEQARRAALLADVKASGQ